MMKSLRSRTIQKNTSDSSDNNEISQNSEYFDTQNNAKKYKLKVHSKSLNNDNPFNECKKVTKTKKRKLNTSANVSDVESTTSTATTEDMSKVKNTRNRKKQAKKFKRESQKDEDIEDQLKTNEEAEISDVASEEQVVELPKHFKKKKKSKNVSESTSEIQLEEFPYKMKHGKKSVKLNQEETISDSVLEVQVKELPRKMKKRNKSGRLYQEKIVSDSNSEEQVKELSTNMKYEKNSDTFNEREINSHLTSDVQVEELPKKVKKHKKYERINQEEAISNSISEVQVLTKVKHTKKSEKLNLEETVSDSTSDLQIKELQTKVKHKRKSVRLNQGEIVSTLSSNIQVEVLPQKEKNRKKSERFYQESVFDLIDEFPNKIDFEKNSEAINQEETVSPIPKRSKKKKKSKSFDGKNTVLQIEKVKDDSFTQKNALSLRTSKDKVEELSNRRNSAENKKKKSKSLDDVTFNIEKVKNNKAFDVASEASAHKNVDGNVDINITKKKEQNSKNDRRITRSEHEKFLKEYIGKRRLLRQKYEQKNASVIQEQNYTFQTSSMLSSPPLFENVFTSTVIKPRKRCDEVSLSSTYCKQDKNMKFDDASISNAFSRDDFHENLKKKNETINSTTVFQSDDDNDLNSYSRRETFLIMPENELNQNYKDATEVVTINDTTFEADPKTYSNNLSLSKKRHQSVIEEINGEFNNTYCVDNEITNKENGSSKETLSKDKLLSSTLNSVRKQWLKYDRNSLEAQTLIEQITTPKLKKKVAVTKKFPEKADNSKASDKKKKLGKMPNFSIIHKKAYDKMEDLHEYSERKKKRAEILLSSSKKAPLSLKNAINLEEISKTRQELFPITETQEKKTNKSKVDLKPKPIIKNKKSSSFSESKSTSNSLCNNKYNRFGFKLPEIKPPAKKPLDNIQIGTAVIKPLVSSRPDIVAIANKTKNVSNTREKSRNLIKGVRSNRRFDLLMEMRNKK